MPRTEKELAELVLFAQDSVNLTAVSKTFAEVTKELLGHGKGSAWVNQHWAVGCLVSKINSLSGGWDTVHIGNCFNIADQKLNETTIDIIKDSTECP